MYVQKKLVWNIIISVTDEIIETTQEFEEHLIQGKLTISMWVLFFGVSRNDVTLDLLDKADTPPPSITFSPFFPQALFYVELVM